MRELIRRRTASRVRPSFRVRPGLAGVALVVLVSLLAAACGGGGLGFDQPPASLDPNSPTMSASNIAFDPTDIDVPAGAAFILVFENTENISHNVSVYADAAYQNRLFEGIVFNGPSTRWYPVPSLAAGTWVFRCDVHPEMNGRLHAS